MQTQLPDLRQRVERILDLHLPFRQQAFTIDYRHAGLQRWMIIGRWPEWNTVAARERARELRRDIDEGADPLSLRETAREAPRVNDMIARYLAEHTPNLAARSAADHHTIMHRLVAPDWDNKLMTEITKADVEKLLTKIASGRARQSKAKPDSRARKLKGPGLRTSLSRLLGHISNP